MNKNHLIAFLLISIYLILDGLISIFILYYQPFEYHVIRYIRMIVGIIIGIGTIEQKKTDLKRWNILFLIFSSYIFFDGIYSVLIQMDQPLLYHLARYFRSFVGMLLGVLVFLKEKKRKLKRSDLGFIAIAIYTITLISGLGLTAYSLDTPSIREFILIISNFILSFGSLAAVVLFYFSRKSKKEEEWAMPAK